MNTVYDAITFAANAHRNQRRKNAEKTPYINHPLSVLRRVSQVTSNPDVLSAAVLHDVVEDCDVSLLEIEKRFGAKVARIVEEVTDDKSLPKMERKRLQIVNAPHKSFEAKLVKLADKTDNVYSIFENPPVWTLERQRQYIEWCAEVVTALGDSDALLLEQFKLARDWALTRVDGAIAKQNDSLPPMDEELLYDEA